MSRRDFTVRDIHMALDGEMPEEERASFESWLDANPDMRALSDRFAADTKAMRDVFDPVVDEPVPDRLVAVLRDSHSGSAEKDLSPRRAGLRWQGIAAAAILLVGIGGGYLAGRTQFEFPDDATKAVVERAIQAHSMFAAEKLHVVEVGADQKDHLVGWLSKRVGLQLIAPDLTSAGFHLVGGRLLPSGAKAAAQFMYEDRTGSRISLYVTSDVQSPESGFRLYEENGARSYYWLDGGYCFALTGTVPEKKLLEMANAAYRQVLDKSEL